MLEWKIRQSTQLQGTKGKGLKGSEGWRNKRKGLRFEGLEGWRAAESL